MLYLLFLKICNLTLYYSPFDYYPIPTDKEGFSIPCIVLYQSKLYIGYIAITSHGTTSAIKYITNDTEDIDTKKTANR